MCHQAADDAVKAAEIKKAAEAKKKAEEEELAKQARELKKEMFNVFNKNDSSKAEGSRADQSGSARRTATPEGSRADGDSHEKQAGIRAWTNVQLRSIYSVCDPKQLESGDENEGYIRELDSPTLVNNGYYNGYGLICRRYNIQRKPYPSEEHMARCLAEPKRQEKFTWFDKKSRKVRLGRIHAQDRALQGPQLLVS